MNADRNRPLGNDGEHEWRADWNPYSLTNCLTMIYDVHGRLIGSEDGREDMQYGGKGLFWTGIRLYQFRQNNKVLGWCGVQYPEDWGQANRNWEERWAQLREYRTQAQAQRDRQNQQRQQDTQQQHQPQSPRRRVPPLTNTQSQSENQQQTQQDTGNNNNTANVNETSNTRSRRRTMRKSTWEIC